MNSDKIPGTNVPKTLVTPDMIARAKQSLLDINTFLDVHGKQLELAGIDYGQSKQQLLQTKSQLEQFLKAYGGQ